MTTPTGDGPVEQYLDDMFDRLAGTGPAGRRLLVEAETHLLTAAAEARARGLDAEAAEREAIDRFGTAAHVTRHVSAATDARASLGRLVTGTWIATGVLMLWWGASGMATWLLSWPWTRLLIATDRFGTQPDMCSRPWVPSNPTLGCFAQYRGNLSLVPVEGDRNSYPWFAVGGLLLLAVWLLVRRSTVLRTTAWTPKPAILGLALAIPFGLAALIMTAYGVKGLYWQAQDGTLSYLTAGLLAAGISIAAIRHIRGFSLTAPTAVPALSTGPHC